VLNRRFRCAYGWLRYPNAPKSRVPQASCRRKDGPESRGTKKNPRSGGRSGALYNSRTWPAETRDRLNQQLDQEVAREVGEEKWKRYELVSWAFDEIMRQARGG